jgi:hypothetical protein
MRKKVLTRMPEALYNDVWERLNELNQTTPRENRGRNVSMNDLMCFAVTALLSDETLKAEDIIEAFYGDGEQ